MQIFHRNLCRDSERDQSREEQIFKHIFASNTPKLIVPSNDQLAEMVMGEIWGVRRTRIVCTTYKYVEVSELEVDAGTDDFEPHTA